MSSTIGEKIDAAGDYIHDKSKQGEHATKQMEAEGGRKMNTEIAKNSSVPGWRQN